MNLYTPPDILEAHDAWGASCGPFALAALLEMPVEYVRTFFPYFPEKTYTNPTDMKKALVAAGKSWIERTAEWPVDRGLVLIQWTGPWNLPGVPPRAAYKYTHWIAFSGGQVFDANAGWIDLDEAALNLTGSPGGMWLPKDEWAIVVAPMLITQVKRCNGWRVRLSLEVGNGR